MNKRNIDLRGIFVILRRRAKLVLFIIVIGMLAAASLLYALPSNYVAKTQLLLDVAGADGSNTKQSNAFGLTNSIVESEVKLIKSEPVLTKAFADLQLLQTEEFGSKRSWFSVFGVPGSPSGLQQDEAAASQAFEEFNKRISAKRLGLTFLIEVTARSENAKRAADIANAVASSHIELKLKNILAQTKSVQVLLDASAVETRKALDVAETQLQSYFVDNLDEFAAQTSDAQLDQIRRELRLVQEDRARDEQRFELLNEIGREKNWDILKSSSISANLQLAQKQRDALLRRIEAEPNSDANEALDEQLVLLQKQINLLVDQEISVIETDLRKGIVLEKDLLSRARNRAVELDFPSPLLRQFYQIKASAETARKQYENALEAASANRVRAATLLSDVRIVSTATVPIHPVSPNRPLMLALALLFFVTIAIILALLLDHYWGGISSSEQLEELLGLRTGAVLPQVESRDASLHARQQNLAFIMDDAPNSAFSEAVRKLRSEIEISAGKANRNSDTGGTVILLSSAVAKEGKSTVSIALAKNLAASGARTLIIDADLRKPTIHEYLGLEGENGLVEFLKDTKETDLLAKSFKTRVAPNLDVLPGRSLLGLKTDALVSSVGFQQLIRSVLRHYDFVILDTPPLLPVVDTTYLLPLADVVLFIVGFQSTDQRQVQHAAKLIVEHASAKAAIIPIINKSDLIAAQYLQHYGGYRFSGITQIAAD